MPAFSVKAIAHRCTPPAISSPASHAIARFEALLADVIMDRLSDADWQELALLIEAAPVGRIRAAMSRVDPSVVSTPPASAARLVTWFDRLLHLATISSGSAFDRALLHELRRLRVH